MAEPAPPPLPPTLTMPRGPVGQARVWMGQLPDVNCEVAGVAERIVPAGAAGPVVGRRAGVEFRRYLGPRFAYAMLGGSFAPIPTDGVVLTVEVAALAGSSVPWLLVPYAEYGRAGLAAEYAESVLRGAADAA